jgi:hypothetical protein
LAHGLRIRARDQLAGEDDVVQVDGHSGVATMEPGTGLSAGPGTGPGIGPADQPASRLACCPDEPLT